jgi:hypothetical protein
MRRTNARRFATECGAVVPSVAVARTVAGLEALPSPSTVKTP